ncbi:MAG: AAA family ATPase [Opitutae bacterium]|nr:AAA family ATPase [Opitutae bacterium]
MSTATFKDHDELAAHLRQELNNEEKPKRFVLLYAYNGTGKTRLSMSFKDIAKKQGAADTLYFNAYTEDLFSWHNDLDGDSERYLVLHPSSHFFAGLEELEMDNRIRPYLRRYADFDFKLDKVPVKDESGKVLRERRIVRFYRNILTPAGTVVAENIKISRGEERLFIWCFFLAIAQLALDGAEAYKWVKYIYVDDPISSLDENNAIAVGHHLAQLLESKGHTIKVVISSHHSLFFNVLWNELREIDRKKFSSQFLARSRKTGVFTLTYTGDTPFFHHLALLKEICEAREADELRTHHFNALRGLLEKAGTFHGHPKFSVCIKKPADDPDETLFGRILNVLSHGNYSYYEPTEMLPETKEHFEKVLDDFLTYYPFNKALLPETPKEVLST